MTKRETPEMLCDYKLALQLQKTFNQRAANDAWL
jgi:hypothetical protein